VNPVPVNDAAAELERLQATRLIDSAFMAKVEIDWPEGTEKVIFTSSVPVVPPISKIQPMGAGKAIRTFNKFPDRTSYSTLVGGFAAGHRTKTFEKSVGIRPVFGKSTSQRLS